MRCLVADSSILKCADAHHLIPDSSWICELLGFFYSSQIYNSCVQDFVVYIPFVT